MNKTMNLLAAALMASAVFSANAITVVAAHPVAVSAHPVVVAPKAAPVVRAPVATGTAAKTVNTAAPTEKIPKPVGTSPVVVVPRSPVPPASSASK